MTKVHVFKTVGEAVTAARAAYNKAHHIQFWCDATRALWSVAIFIDMIDKSRPALEFSWPRYDRALEPMIRKVSVSELQESLKVAPPNLFGLDRDRVEGDARACTYDLERGIAHVLQAEGVPDKELYPLIGQPADAADIWVPDKVGWREAYVAAWRAMDTCFEEARLNGSWGCRGVYR